MNHYCIKGLRLCPCGYNDVIVSLDMHTVVPRSFYMNIQYSVTLENDSSIACASIEEAFCNIYSTAIQYTVHSSAI